jgi:hypothetical protein
LPKQNKLRCCLLWFFFSHKVMYKSAAQVFADNYIGCGIYELESCLSYRSF